MQTDDGVARTTQTTYRRCYS